MNRADVYLTRIRLGVFQQTLADLCGVGTRTVKRWEEGRTQIDAESADQIQALADGTDLIVGGYITAYLDAGGGVFTTFRPGSGALVDRPDLPCLVPAFWHNTVAARIYAACPNVQVSFVG